MKTVGKFTLPVKLHKDVTAHPKVVIEKESAAE
jgi:ribosomal protein L9